MRTLIKNTLILSMDESTQQIENGHIYIEDDIIKEVGKGEYTKDVTGTDINIIDGKGYLTMPGLINCHTHAAMTLLRGYGEGLPLMKWLNEKIWPMESKFNEKHIEVGTKLAFIEMLRSGTTTFNDMYFYQDKVLEAAKEFKIRAVLGIPLIGEEWGNQLKQAVELMKKVESEKSDEYSAVKSMFAPHSAYTLSYDALVQIGEAAKQHKKDIHIHISETADETAIIKNKYDMTVCELLEKTGIFNSRVVGAHCVHLNDGDVEIIKNHEVSPVYNSQSNMKLASGVARVAEMNSKGINVCIGTDGTSSNNNLNMFEEMETGAMLQKLWYNDTTKIDAETMIRFATVNGAKALGWDNLGKLKEGYKADIIMLNLSKAHMHPIYDINSNIVFSANGSEVETVLVDGKLIMYKGELLNIDEEKILYECDKLCCDLIKK